MDSWIKKAAGIIFTDGKSILLMKKAGEGENIGTWGIPGGKAKSGETEIGNAIRETKEETGLDTIPGTRFDQISNRSGQTKFTAFFYLVPKTFDIDLSTEHSEFEWVRLDDMKEFTLHPKLKENLPEYRRKIERKTARPAFTEWLRALL